MARLRSSSKWKALPGSLLLLCGSLLAAMIFVHRATDLPVPFPRIWYQTQSFHVVVCVALFATGAFLLWRSRVRPEEAGVLFDSVVVYSKPDCELCDNAMAVLDEYRDYFPSIELIDISGHEDLQMEFGDCIPVVEIDGVVRFRGRVNRSLLERLILAKRRRKLSADETLCEVSS